MNLLPKSGLMFEPQFGLSLGELVEAALFAEKRGYGYVFRSDHFISTSGKPIEDSSECWVSMGALAARTSRIKFGALVSPVGFRNPALLAEMACTAHAFSGGRLQLGVGAGWFRDEYLAYGFRFPSFRERVAQLEEALQIIRPLLDGRKVDFRGRFFRAHAECIPKPRGGVHLIVGGHNRRVVGLAARFSDEWNIYSPALAEFRELKSFFDSKCSRNAPEVSQMCGFLLAETRTGLRKEVARHMKFLGMSGDVDVTARQLREKGSFVGVTDEFVSQVNEALEAGADKVYFEVLDPSNRDEIEYLTQTLKTKF